MVFIADRLSAREFERERKEIKPEQHTCKRERAGSGWGAVCVGCYPCCHVQAFISGVTSQSESIVKAREGQATVAQHTHKRRGRKGATVAWCLPGLGFGIYIKSKTLRQCVLRKEMKVW